jgi:MFS family permease
MPVYLQKIGFSIVIIGFLEGVAEATAGLSKGYFGNKSDNVGKRLPFVKLGYALTALSRILLAAFTSIPMVFAARLTDRVGKGVRTAARDAMLSTESTKETKATVFGFHRSFDTLGATIGPLIALAYLYFFPNQYHTLILISVIPCLLAVLATFLISENQLEKPEVKNHGFFNYLNYWKVANSNYKKTIIPLLFFAIINSSDVFLLLFLKEQGYTDVQMIGCYVFYNFIYAATAYPIGKLADKIGLLKVIVSGILLFALVYLLIGFAKSILAVGLLFLAYGIYAACFESTSKAFIVSNCNPAETATAIGFYSGFVSIASLIASVWTGILWLQFGPQIALTLSGILALAITLWLILSHQKNKLNPVSVVK